jgi:hypothetical protein
MVNVAAVHHDVVKRWNLVRDAKYHPAHNGKGQKEADRREKKPAARTVGNMLTDKGTERSAMKKQQQGRYHRQQK